MKKLSGSLKNSIVFLILILTDFIAFSLAFALAFYTRMYIAYVFFLPKFIITGYIIKLLWVPFIFLFFFFVEGLYTKRVHFWYELKLLAKAIFIAFLVCLAIVSIGKLTDFISRLFLFLLFFYSLLVFAISRILVKNILFKTGLWKERIMIIGLSEVGLKFAQSFNNNQYLGFEVLGFISDKVEHANSFKVIAPLSHAERIIKRLNIKTAVLDENALNENELAVLAQKLQGYLTHIIVIPKLSLLSLLNSEINYLFVEKLFILSVKNNLQSLSNRVLKRCFDLIVSIMLLPILIPAMLVIAILIRLDSKGSCFYVSKRLGQGGKQFNFLKFRTMYIDNDKILKDYLETNRQAKQEWERFKKLKSFDPRVTHFGKFLRKTSLDELPQFINVLFGQMSLLGPRPYLESELEKIGESFKTIVLAKPGISGLWQVSGRNELDFQMRVGLDCFYVTNWSLWFDIIILLKTVHIVLTRKGAY